MPRYSAFSVPSQLLEYRRAFISYNEDTPMVYTTISRHRQNRTAKCMNHTDGRRFPRLPGTVPRDSISLQTSICLSNFFILFSSKALTISHLELVVPVGITVCRASICPPITRTSLPGSSISPHSCTTFISIAVLGVPRPIMYMVLLLVQLLAGTTLAAIILTPLGHIIVSSSHRRVCVGCSG